MIIFGVFFLVLQTYFVFFQPKYFLFAYLLFISSFLGFISNQVLVSGMEIGLFYQSVLMMLVFIRYFRRILDLTKHFKILLFLIVFIYVYGIVKPVSSGMSSLTQSIIASKEFSTLFLIPYLFIFRNFFSINYIIKVLSFFGYYFLFILILFLLLDFIPVQYVKGVGAIEFYYPTILSLFLFIKSGHAKNILEIVLVLFLLTIWSVGMYFEGHLALMLTTTFGCISVIFKLPVINFVNKKSWFILAIVSILLLSTFSSYLTELSKFFNESSSIASRNIVNEARMELIFERPLFGYGFMHDSALELDSNNSYGKNLFVIDSGYIDLLGKFGYVGMFIYLFFLTIPFLKRERNIVMISLKLFFFQLFFVNITWSVFSFSMGIISISIALFFFYNYKNNLKTKSFIKYI